MAKNNCIGQKNKLPWNIPEDLARFKKLTMGHTCLMGQATFESILGYLGKDALPKFTVIGLVYFSLLLAMTYIINFAVSRLYKNKKYSIKARDIERDIK